MCVRWSVGPSVGPSVSNAFDKNARKRVFIVEMITLHCIRTPHKPLALVSRTVLFFPSLIVDFMVAIRSRAFSARKGNFLSA